MALNEQNKWADTTGDEAVRHILAGGPLKGCAVSGKLFLNGLGNPSKVPAGGDDTVVAKALRITQCKIEAVEGHSITIEAPVEWEDSVFGKVGLYSWFFTHGLRITRCTFKDFVHLMWGGHNKSGPVVIEDAIFKGFVDFDDCWFMGPVILRNVRFEAGSNLLASLGKPPGVTFAVPPVLENVEGDLGVEGRFPPPDEERI